MRPETEAHRLDAAVESLVGKGVGSPALALVLGSGLSDFATNLESPTEIAYHDIANWPVPQVQGHGGSLVVGELGGLRVACLTGRVHLYEGWHPADVVRPVRTLRRLGVGTFVLTNAAGGLGEGFRAGDLMAITDHVNQTGSSPLLGPHEDVLGPRFPDQSAVYDAGLRQVMLDVDPDLQQGVYLGLLGPSYETPAEVRMLKSFGVHAVGMSTVHEAMAVNAMGARIAGVSLISNLAAGTADRPLSHDEVIAAGDAAAARFTRLLVGFCQEIAPGEEASS